MSIFKKCPFYRGRENPTVSSGVGYCDIGGGQALCEADVQFCDKPDVLRRQLEQRNGEILENREVDQHKKSSKYKVLVVDDEEPLRNIVVAFLSREGHQCATASNGMEALTKIDQNRFDAVITDIVMPQMNGIVLTKELLSLHPKLPIMVMTGHSKEYPTELAIGAGTRDFIRKPFAYDELILRFNKMMRDQETSLEVESRQNQRIFHIQRESLERVNELQRKVESLESRLHFGSHFNR